MGNLIVPPNWVNSTNFKMSSAASLTLVKTDPNTLFPTIFCFILGLLGMILVELGLSRIDLGPKNWECGYFLLGPRKWSILEELGPSRIDLGPKNWECGVCGSGPFVSPMEDAIAHGAAFSFLVYHSYIFLFLFEGREGGDVGYILEEKKSTSLSDKDAQDHQ